MEPVAVIILLVAGLATGIGILFVLLYNSNKNLKNLKIENSNIIEIRDTFSNIEDSIITLKDENLKYMFVNEAAENYYQKPAKDIIGKDDLILGKDQFGEDITLTDRQVIDSGEILNYEVKCKNRIYKVKKFPVKIKNDKIGIGAYIREVTDELKLLKKQEKVLFRNKILVNVLSKSFRNDQKQLDYVLHEALKLTETAFGYIYIYDEAKEEFTINSWSKGLMEHCHAVEQPLKYHLAENGLWGEAIQLRKPVIINDYQADSRLKERLPEGHIKLINFMTVPLIVDGKVLAVAGFGNKKGDFDDNDVYEITVLINGVWSNMERRAVQEKLFKERSKYLQTLISIGDGVMVVDPDGKIEMLNKIAQHLTGWSMEAAEGRHYKEVFVLSHDDSVGEIIDPIEKVMETDAIQELKNHALLISKYGTIYHLEDSAAPIKDENGMTIGVVLVFRDVTEKKQQQRAIEYLSFHDALTGLYNRRFLEEELLRLDTVRNLPISIIMGDVNGLKLTNDIFGHAHGDIFLKKIAEVMKRICRSDDIIARWGGDEFVILLPQTTSQQASQIMNRIKIEFARDGIKVIKGNISLGCDVKTSMDQSIMACLESAEEKMYAAKILERDDFKSTTLDSIITTLQSDSPREEEHALRVSQWCHDLGVSMELPHVKIRRLKLAGYFHDIGKIILDKDLLDQNSELSEEEWIEIKKHPIVGYRILNAFDDTMSLADAVLHHHERWDGTGYPKGLKGQEIPFLARVVAVANCYDRLSQNLVAEASVSKRNPLMELKKLDGQLDPEITREFIKMIEDPPA
ncbi:MAG: diguanylate cyclase [Acetobacterium woodii]|nr:diguanylate cyclase [Acetobacterium woodii]